MKETNPYRMVTKEEIENRHHLVSANWKGLALRLLAEREAYRDIAIEGAKAGGLPISFIDAEALKLLEEASK